MSSDHEQFLELPPSSPGSAEAQMPLKSQSIAGTISSDREQFPELPPSLPEQSIPQAPPKSLPSQSHEGKKNLGLSLDLQSKQGWISRILVFLALEIAYLVVAAIACFQPIVLPSVCLLLIQQISQKWATTLAQPLEWTASRLAVLAEL
jgi:hypothetical protein